MISEARIINLPKNEEERGYLTYIEKDLHIPFKIEYAYWINIISNKTNLKDHAFSKEEQVIIAISGSVEMKVRGGKKEKIFPLNRPYYGLYISSDLDLEINKFSSNAVILVLGSKKYFKRTNYFDFNKFKSL